MRDAGRAADARRRGGAHAPTSVREAGGGATVMARVGTREGGQAGRRREVQSAVVRLRRLGLMGRRSGGGGIGHRALTRRE